MRQPTKTATQERARSLLARAETRIDDTLAEESSRWRATDPMVADVVDALRRFVCGGGKRLRPAFCIYGFLGAVEESHDEARDGHAVAIAAALELLHAFALVHDDVMDGSTARRGAPSVHAQFERAHQHHGWAGEARRFGEGIAILVGDLAHVLAERALVAASPELRAGWHELQLELIRGQALDMHAAARRCVDTTIARRIAVLKSGRYTVLRPLQLGALAAGRADIAASYVAFGEPLGEAFQLRDDIIGAFGDVRETGKPVGDDLREGKPTFLLACAHARADARQRHVLRRAGADDLSDDEVRAMQRVLVECGARERVELRVEDLTGDAFAALDRAPVPSAVRAALRDLAVAAVWRQS